MIKIILGSNIFRDNPELDRKYPGARSSTYEFRKMLISEGLMPHEILSNRFMLANGYIVDYNGNVYV